MTAQVGDKLILNDKKFIFLGEITFSILLAFSPLKSSFFAVRNNSNNIF